ncbi:hypothetical protein P0136_00495 [Lentisphaerota bacterium ZTH]|nr:hypothetical protein JYG24_08360 [Lentisphaerota bacterium]WET06493.1 hypothetical protein P0136_00495 [Lentisphaerota bacterium ZTH]
MPNIEKTEARVRNVMNSMPKAVLNRRGEKLRSTMKQTFSGMKTLLGQLSQGNTEKIRKQRRRKKIIVLSTIALAAAILIAIIIITAT